MNLLPRLLPTVAMLLLLCLAALAGYSFRDFADDRSQAGAPRPVLDPQTWMSSPPSPDREAGRFADGSPPKEEFLTTRSAEPGSGRAATGEPAESRTQANLLSSERSDHLAETILQGTGETWREASDEARLAMSRMVAAWLHAGAPAADLDQWAHGYQQQLDELSRQPQAAAAKISDWLPVVHGHLLTQTADGPSS